MTEIIIYVVLIALYVGSYFLLKKYDCSKRRLVFVTIWAIFMIALMLYPFFLPKWWKLTYFLSGFIICSMFFIDAEQEKGWTPTNMGS